MKSTKMRNIDSIYSFMEKVYEGGWKLRFSNTPFMDTPTVIGHPESILAHELALIGFWFQIRRICPALNALVDTTKLYETFFIHDLGEIKAGDVSNASQVHGAGKGKDINEHTEIRNLMQNSPDDIKNEVSGLFQTFEDKSNLASPELLLARYIDQIEGDFFALVYGKNLPENSDLISKIVNRKSLLYGCQLIKLLKDLGNEEATQEAIDLVQYHINRIKDQGIKVEISEDLATFLRS